MCQDRSENSQVAVLLTSVCGGDGAGPDERTGAMGLELSQA
jgi:hypothetical protein